MTRKEGLRSIFESIIETAAIPEDSSRAREAEIKADDWYQDSDSRKALKQHMARYDLIDASDTITAQAIALRSRELDTIDNMIASAEARRASVLAQVEYYRRGLGRRLSAAEQVIDVEARAAPAIASGSNSEEAQHPSGEVQVGQR